MPDYAPSELYGNANSASVNFRINVENVRNCGCIRSGCVDSDVAEIIVRVFGVYNDIGHAKNEERRHPSNPCSTSHIATSRPAGLRYGKGQPTAGSETCRILTLELDHLKDPSQR